MLSLLIRIFIKNKDDVTNPKVREKYGVLCGIYGIFLNCMLFALKYIAGILSASIAMTADAFNNLSDAGSSLISVIGFKLGAKKPDEDHPYGHGRLEYIAALIVSGIIVVMGYELITESFKKILYPEENYFSFVSVSILIISILVKCYMSFYAGRIGKKIDSKTLKATSTDALSDTISSFVVLTSALVNYFFNINIDGYAGLIVGIIIIIAGCEAAMDTISPLLGGPPSAEFVKSVEDIVMSYDNIVGLHDLIVHDYGPGRRFISLHAEVPNDKDINELHDVIDRIEHKLKQKLNCQAVIHMDPVAVNDPISDELKKYISELVKKVDESLTIHDFRAVIGPTHTNLVFDCDIPFKVKKSDEEVAQEIQELVWKDHTNYYCVMDIDRD